ncbi:hypothetical protein [Actinophytocola sp.]|uniref:hypothetical protein n=1 Tax=Actinophytocola sp. TaxID=1872138 RepID=UPI002D7F3789|nr:hypothetical protein [Actinophytocola sp.]
MISPVPISAEVTNPPRDEQRGDRHAEPAEPAGRPGEPGRVGQQQAHQAEDHQHAGVRVHRADEGPLELGEPVGAARDPEQEHAAGLDADDGE